MPAPEETVPDRATELALQRAQVEVLSARLTRAERAVAQACTPLAATDAHRKADALLLDLEAAEHRMRALEHSTVRPSTRRRGPAQQPGQGQLFDAG